VTKVSVHQIAEPAILHSDQPSLIADPPDHTPPRPTSNSPPPSRTYRLTLRVPRISDRKRRRDDMCKWKRESEAKKARVRRNKPSQRGRTKAHTQQLTHGGTKDKQRKRIQQGTKADLSTKSIPKDVLHAHTRTHTSKSSTKAAQEERPRCGGCSGSVGRAERDQTRRGTELGWYRTPNSYE